MSNRRQRSHRRVILAISLTVLPAVILAGLALWPRTRGTRPNILWITMDSLRHDHLGCTGHARAQTPNIDALAADGAIFTEALAQGTYTTISVPSMLCGKFPYILGIQRAGLPLDSSHTTLSEVLSENGYFTTTNSERWSRSYYQGFHEIGHTTQTTPERTEWTLEKLRKHRDKSFFIWLYYWDPHAPYQPPETFMRAYEPDYRQTRPQPAETALTAKERRALMIERLKEDRFQDNTGHYDGSISTLLKLNQGAIELGTGDLEHLINLYDAEIAHVDEEIGRVVAMLKELDLYDNTLILLNADHGEGFGEHGKFYHGMTVFDEMARVPVIIKPPGSRNENKTISNQVRNIDIMATILDYCQLQIPKDCIGQSLRPLVSGKDSFDQPSITETYGTISKQLVGFRHQNYKLIYGLSDHRVWLYDLQSDPGETSNLLTAEASIMTSREETISPARQREQRMRQQLLKLLDAKTLDDLSTAGKNLPEIDERTKEQMRALGYVY